MARWYCGPFRRFINTRFLKKYTKKKERKKKKKKKEKKKEMDRSNKNLKY